MRTLTISLLLLCCVARLSAQSFTISVDPPQRFLPEATTTWTVTVTPSGGFSAPVFFNARPLDDLSATTSFSPEVLRSPYGTPVTLTLTYNGVKNGSTHRLEIEGYNGIVSSRDTITLTAPSTSAWRTFTRQNSQFGGAMGKKFIIDSSGNGWFGLGTSVQRFDGTSWTSFSEIAPGVIASATLAADRNGVWVSTIVNPHKAGLAYYDGSSWSHFDTTTGYSDSLIGWTVENEGGLTFAVALPSGLWVRSYNGLLHHDATGFHVQRIPVDAIYWMVAGNDGRLWFPVLSMTKPYEVATFDGKFWNDYPIAELGYPNMGIFVAIDPSGRLWTTHGYPNTLYTLDPATMKATEFTMDDGTDSARRGVLSLAWDTRGHMWLGHGRSPYYLQDRRAPAGVHRFDGTTWWHYTQENSGLPDNNVFYIQVDPKSNAIWFLTETGLAILDGNADPGTGVAGATGGTTPTPGGSGMTRPVTVYPNPTSGVTTIGLSLGGTSRVGIVVTNLLGRTVARTQDRVLDAGEQQLPLDLTGLAPGAYMVRTIVEDHVQAVSMAIVQ